MNVNALNLPPSVVASYEASARAANPHIPLKNVMVQPFGLPSKEIR